MSRDETYLAALRRAALDGRELDVRRMLARRTRATGPPVDTPGNATTPVLPGTEAATEPKGSPNRETNPTKSQDRGTACLVISTTSRR